MLREKRKRLRSQHGEPMTNDRLLSDAATLLACLGRGARNVRLRAVLATWDMLQADVPTRERVEAAASFLVGQHLISVDATWDIRLTTDGTVLRRSVRVSGGMRSLPSALAERLRMLRQPSVAVSLPVEVFAAALDAYRASAERWTRAPKRRWWRA